MTPKDETASAVVKATVGVIGMVASNITLNELVQIGTLFYLAMQAGLLVPKYLRLWRERRG